MIKFQQSHPVYSKSLKKLILFNFSRDPASPKSNNKSSRKTSNESSSLKIQKKQYQHEIDKIIEQKVMTKQFQLELPNLKHKNKYQGYRIKTERATVERLPLKKNTSHQKAAYPLLSSPFNSQKQDNKINSQRIKTQILPKIQHDGKDLVKSLKKLELHIDINKLQKIRQNKKSRYLITEPKAIVIRKVQ